MTTTPAPVPAAPIPPAERHEAGAVASPVIEAHGLHVGHGGRWLLRDVGFSVHAGERVALVGHNGAGKSTLLRALTGWAVPDRGRLQVLGTPLAGPGLPARPLGRRPLRHLRARVATVHQGLHLVGRLSALDNVLIGGAARHAGPASWCRRWPAAERRAAADALARVGLAAVAGQRTDTLSGGERQKLALARALHQRAGLLLADEPTAALDPQAALDMARLLAATAADRAATLLSIVHDLDLLPLLADRVLVLRHGELVADLPVASDTASRLHPLLR